MNNANLAWLGTTVVVWAHPDDETYLSGGTAAALVGSGQRVVAVTATRGEAGGPESTPHGRAETARRPHRGARGGPSDPRPPRARVAGLRGRLLCRRRSRTGRTPARRLFDDVRPDTVLTFGPDGFTGHPDHQAVSGWVDLALGRSTATPRLLHAVATEQDRVDPQLDSDFGVFELGEPRLLEPDELALRHVLDPDTLRRKVAALRAQESQTAGLIEAVGLERYTAWVAVEGFAEPALVPAD